MSQTDTADSAAARCPINYSMDMFGDRWTLLIVRDMLFFGKRRYNEFLASNEGISTNILASRLKRLQDLSLVEKFPDPENARTALYLLTERGLSLFPVILEIIRWGLGHDDRSIVSPEVSDALAHGPESLANSISLQMREERAALQRT